MIEVNQERIDELATRQLGKGAHGSLSEGMCVMEAVSYVAGEPWSDSPECASPTIARFLRNWNDGLPNDETRTRLLHPLIPRLVGTAGTAEQEERRGWMALDWMVRVMTPAWLELAGLKDHADTIRDLAELTDEASCEAANPALSAARSAAESAAESAAKSAAWSAAESAAWSAAESAAEKKLQPTVETFQQSALELVDRMILVTEAA